VIIPKVGDLIELIEMPDDPDPIPAGTQGTVTYVGKRASLGQQIGVDWENGRSLMLVNGIDRFRIL
jgi:hypothetical protein